MLHVTHTKRHISRRPIVPEVPPSNISMTSNQSLHPTQILDHMRQNAGEMPATEQQSRDAAFIDVLESFGKCEYSRALVQTSSFLHEHFYFSPLELGDLQSTLYERSEEKIALIKVMQDTNILIQYDTMVLQQKNLSTDARSMTTKQLLGSKVTLEHEEESMRNLLRNIGILGAVILDSKWVFSLLEALVFIQY